MNGRIAMISQSQCERLRMVDGCLDVSLTLV